MPKVSVLVPIYGVEKFLKEALDSVLKQTMTDIEIILVDDGSKDACPQIVDEYAQKDSRIIAIHKENGGYGSAMNVGLAKATGEYIAILEPDDYIESNMYEDLYKIAKEFDSDIVKSCYFDNLQSKEETRILKVKWNDKIPENKSFTIKECPYFLYYHPSIWSCIYKKEFLDNHDIKFIEAPGSGWTDNPFQVQTMCLAQRINYTSKAYYYWRRLNRNESDDLKDYTIPFKRSDEIHQWLDENGIDDEGILASLYFRELGYIQVVLGMKKIPDKNNCLNLIKTMTDKMDKNILTTSELLKKQKKFITGILKNPMKERQKLLFKRFRRNLISIRKEDKNIRIVIMGNTVMKGDYGN